MSADRADADMECADCAFLAGVAAKHWARAADEGPESIVSIDDMISAQRTAARVDRPSLLATRELADDERAAQDTDPRPGIWAGEGYADLRALTQDETDRLIRCELFHLVTRAERRDLVALLGDHVGSHQRFDGDRRDGITQRGGIDRDPLVRVLAHRAWGDRDRQWFELRGVREGEPVAIIPGGDPRRASVALAWPGERAAGRALHSAGPGETVRIERIAAVPGARGSRYRHHRDVARGAGEAVR